MTLTPWGMLTFGSPWLLAALAALPILWWLLRLTPPRPETIPFPPASLLLGLRSRDRTPVRSPWWLTLLRMLIVTAIILALAGPTLKPPSVDQAVTAPTLVVVDTGWASASRWEARTKLASQIAAAAEEAGQTLYLADTTGTESRIEPLTPAQFRQRFASLTPAAYADDRAAAARRLKKDLDGKQGAIRVAWLSDGIGDAGADEFVHVLEALAGSGRIDVYTDRPGDGALAILQPAGAQGAVLRATVVGSEAVPRSGQVAAETIRGERLAVVPFDLSASERRAEVSVSLPLELRNQVTRLEIAGERSAGAVALLDARSQRRRVGLVASEVAEEAQPLLSPAYYLERALSPYADIVKARAAALDQATAEVLRANPSVVILSDVGRLAGPPRERLRAFVEKGGMLVRFAGVRLERGGDSLLPVTLREGGRTLGGVLTWTAPEAPAPFESGSPFEGLSIPKDVTISKQVLADPTAMSHDVQVWARLKDGTPLVTAARRGGGELVFFHVTANPDWSTLPISGLFVEMMQKILERAPLQSLSAGATPAPESETAATRDASVLKPWRVLDGFGKLAEPGERAQAIASSELPIRATAASPAGLYGPQNALRAVNALAAGDTLSPVKMPSGAEPRLLEQAQPVALSPWLYLAGLGLFMLDALLCAFVVSASTQALRRRGAVAAAFLGLLWIVPSPGAAGAQPEQAAAPADTTAFALQASLETRLAFIRTGDTEADRVSKAGLTGLSKILNARTAVEPGEPMGIDPAKDELVFFPLIYWPVLPNAAPLSDEVLAKIDSYMKQGGLIIFDTKNSEGLDPALSPADVRTPLATLIGKLDLPPLQKVSEGHVLTKSFYLLQTFPGRWDNGDPWVEAPSSEGDAVKRGVKTDGVSSILITSNDLAAAWALDDSDRPIFAVVPGGDEQREMAFRFGVNIVMYALTGNYKSDQVHVPAILERLGH